MGKARGVKPIPFGMTFKRALQGGYASVESEKYLELVRRMPCCVCMAPPRSDPHHIVLRNGIKGFNRKVPDVWAIPLCRFHHDEIQTIGSEAWDERHGCQKEFALLTLAQLFSEGLIETSSTA
jgi:hypothetical protein